MSRGISLSIGLNSFDPAHYGWSGELFGCEHDARDIALIARNEGFEPRLLLTRDATREAVLSEIAAAAAELQDGDSFVLSYSGHGGYLPDQDGDENDGQDETWCLYDAQLIDDETYLALNAFSAGVRILVLADSCHAGTSVKAFPPMFGSELGWAGGVPPAAKSLPRPIADRTYLTHRAFYDELASQPALKDARAGMRASAILIAACMDEELSYDGTQNGDFTAALKTVWNGGVFRSSHGAFHKAIRARLTRQTPNFYTIGPDDPAFAAARPFTLDAGRASPRRGRASAAGHDQVRELA